MARRRDIAICGLSATPAAAVGVPDADRIDAALRMSFAFDLSL